MLKKSIIIFLSVFFLVTPVTFAEQPIKVTVDGFKLEFDVPPVLENGRVLVPFRAIFEELGAEVTWDNTLKKVTAVKDDTTVSLTVGEKVAYKGGQPVELDVPAKIIDNRTLVPVRFISEALGNEVIWKQDSKFVAIRTTPQKVWMKSPELNRSTNTTAARMPFWVMMNIYSSGNPYKGLGLAPYDMGQDIMIKITLTYNIDTPNNEAYFKTETLNVIEYSPYITITGPDEKILEIELPAFKGPMKPGEEYYIRYFWDQKDMAGKQVPVGVYSFDLDWRREPHRTVLRYSDENGKEYTQKELTQLFFAHEGINIEE